jgi:tripartite-type tricarboxylate transporter receptor subunit TctC
MHREQHMAILKISALLGVLAVASTSSLHAAGYPDRPVKVIVPFPAGGVTDIATRVIVQRLSERLGQQFYVENIGGAGGNIGMGDAAHAAGDGYTMLFASSSIVVNPSLYKKLPFDLNKDLIPVTKAGISPNSWLVNRDFPAKTMKELIDLMKASPGQLSVASPGTGTTPSLSIELLKQELGVSFVTVPFAGGGPMTQSLLAGFTPIACGAIGNSVPLIKEGRMGALAITSDKRLATLPDVATLDELGFKNQQAETMTGVFVPGGTPRSIVELLQKEISTIVRMPDVAARLLDFCVIPEGDSSADFAAYIKNEVGKWKRVIEIGKIDKI